ncbi:uncharacterized protein LOC120336249 [Styela clava]
MVIYGRLNCPWKPNSDVIAVAEAACVFESEYGHRDLFLFPGVVDAPCSLVPLMVVNVGKDGVEIPADLLIGLGLLCPRENRTVSSLEQVVPGDVMDTRELPEHLKNIVDDPVDLTDEQRQSVHDLLVKFQDVLAGPDGKLGRTSDFSHFVYRIKNVNTGNCRIAHVDHLRLYLREDCDSVPVINADFPDNIAVSNDDEQDVVIPVDVEPEVYLDLPVGGSDENQVVTRSGRTRRRPAYLDDFHT